MSRKVFMSRRIIPVSLAILFAFCVTGFARQDNPRTETDRITVKEFRKLLADNKDVVILDVRGYVETRIRGARHIPLGELESRMKELPEGSTVVTYCA